MRTQSYFIVAPEINNLLWQAKAQSGSIKERGEVNTHKQHADMSEFYSVFLLFQYIWTVYKQRRLYPLKNHLMMLLVTPMSN